MRNFNSRPTDKLNQSADQSFPRRYARFPVLLVFALLIGCKVTLIGDYDDILDKGVTDLQQTADTYFAKLLSTPTTPYDQSFHDSVHARLAVLTSRASTLPKYTIINDQLGNLTKQFGIFQQLDQTSNRPISAAVINDAESGIDSSVEAILKLELALKRTGNATTPSPK